MNNLPFLAYRSFLTPLNTIERFAKADYHTMCVFLAHTVNSRGTPYSAYPPVWKWFDRLDFTPFDQMIYDASKAMPNAELLCMIDLNSPVWLEHYMAFECCDSFNNLGKAVHNPFWRKAVKDYLQKFLRYADQQYGSRIQAYILACGATDEWYDYSLGTEDQHRRDAWREWCRKNRLPDPVDIPPISVRDHISHEDFLRDPAADRTALNYWKFCNESIADTILDFASVTRKTIRKSAQIGCFYGYILEKAGSNLVSCGHLDYERVLSSPDIDFLISPGTYSAARKIGGGSGFLIPHGTAAVRGKRLLHECDQRTHTYNAYLTPEITLRVNTAWPDEASTVAGLKREAALGLVNRTHLWWFDMWNDFYQGEAVMNTLRQIRHIWTACSGSPAKDITQIAMVVDPDSTYYLNQDHPDVPQINQGTRNRLNLIGAPFEVYSFNDIPMIKNFAQYRLVIFTSLFHLTPEKKKILKQLVLKDGRTVLWLGPAGVIDGEKYDPENIRRLTGIAPDAKEITACRQKNWQSVCCRDYQQISPAVLKELAAAAGVHLYTDREWPVYAEGSLLAVHSADGGLETIRVPKQSGTVTELFSGKTAEIRNGQFLYRFQKPDTALFDLSGRPKTVKPASAKAPQKAVSFLSKTWSFSADARSADLTRIPAKCQTFTLGKNHGIDLDVPAGKKGRSGDECMIYNEFELGKARELGFGAGADWWFEVYLNGKEIFSTLTGGNVSKQISAGNHSFSGKGRKGRNLLAVRVRRGNINWAFFMEEIFSK
ncbi:MAG: hypothetical protein IJH79_16850 [Lentisphaeria bacterium]|nr:hypothetical protein [Lentisphaeria bacterium]